MLTQRSCVVFTLSLLCSTAIAYKLPEPPTRDKSTWPSTIEYSSTTFYQLLPCDGLYNDRVAVLGVSFSIGQLGYLYSIFGTVIPRNWWIFDPKTTVNYMDPVDAIALGVQVPSPEIVAEGLRIIEKTKAFQGQEASYGQPKIDVTHAATLLFDSLDNKVNRGTLYKVLAPAASIFMYLLPAMGGAKEVAQSLIPNEAQGNAKFGNGFKWAGMGAAAITAYLSNRLQKIYIECAIKCYDLLINSDKVVIGDKALVKSQLLKLQLKMKQQLIGSAYARKFKTLASQL